MGHAAEKSAMTSAEYLAWEAAQTERHEFVNGEVFVVNGEISAMAGAEDRHVTVTLNVAMALRQCLRGTPCRTFLTDMKLHVAAANSYFYPDVMVTCSAADLASPLSKSEPVLLVEVLSPSTAAYDRGEKFAQYRRIPALQEYMLVDLDTRCTDVYRKGADGMWVLHPFESGQTVQLASVNLDITTEALFAEVDPPPADPALASGA
jgi:Uma2 family endonuclease